MSSQSLRSARTLGERSLRVDHAGEHGAISIYRAQRWVAAWRAPQMLDDIDEFLRHEERHRALFAAELVRRGIRRCRSFHLCGLGGLFLGAVTGLLGARAIALTTEAVESVVLDHLQHQLAVLNTDDPEAASVIESIVADEREHHDRSADKLRDERLFDDMLRPFVTAGTKGVIWLGMRKKLILTRS